MKITRWLVIVVVVSLLIAGISVYAQVRRPFCNGSVWSISFIRMKPGEWTRHT